VTRTLRALVTVVAAVGLVVAGCGGDDGGPDAVVRGPAEAGTPEWSTARFDGTPVDSATVVAVSGDETVVVTTIGDRLAAWHAGPDLEFSPADTPAAPPAPPPDAEVGEARLLTAAGGPSGFLAVAQRYPELRPLLFRSADGASWEEVAADGLDEPADITSIAAVDDGWIAVGARRVGPDPASGPFAPGVWHSADGVTWERVDVPGAGDVAVRDVAVVGDTAVAVGASDGRAAAWRSDDAGASWQALDLGGAASGIELSSIAVSGDTLVATAPGEGGGEGPGVVVVRSDDGGRTWTPVEPSADVERALGSYGTIAGDVEGFWLTGSTFFDPWQDPHQCYVDLESCTEGSDPVLLRSADGDEWERLDVEALDHGEYFDLSSVATTASGAVVVAGVDSGITIWTWADGSAEPPRFVAPPAEPEPELPPLVEWSAQLEPGVTYRYPLYVHCGMGVLGEFNGTYWYRSTGSGSPSLEVGDPQTEHWPVAGQTIYGMMTLTADDRIEYSIPSGEVIARYEPRDRQPPGCD
jgi:hypothetical protein